jgi:Peptidase MA superfamily
MVAGQRLLQQMFARFSPALRRLVFAVALPLLAFTAFAPAAFAQANVASGAPPIALVAASAVAPNPPVAGVPDTLAPAPQILRETAELPEPPHDFVRVEIGGFLTLRYPRGAESRVAPIVNGAAAFKAKLIEVLGAPVLSRVEVRVGKDPEEMALLAPIGQPPLQYASGISYRGIGLILISLKAPHSHEAVDVEETFRHELVHQALDDAGHGNHVPAWFHEGLAVHLSGESAMQRHETLANAVTSKSILPLADLDAHMPNEHADAKVSAAYAQSADFVRFLLRQGDGPRFAALISRVGKGQVFGSALNDAYGTDLRKLEYQWVQTLEDRFPLWLALGTGGAFWSLGIVALLMAHVRKKRAGTRTLARWEAEEERLARARIRVLDQHVAATQSTQDYTSVLQPVVPRLQHEGEWYTLH